MIESGDSVFIVVNVGLCNLMKRNKKMLKVLRLQQWRTSDFMAFSHLFQMSFNAA